MLTWYWPCLGATSRQCLEVTSRPWNMATSRPCFGATSRHPLFIVQVTFRHLWDADMVLTMTWYWPWFEPVYCPGDVQTSWCLVYGLGGLFIGLDDVQCIVPKSPVNILFMVQVTFCLWSGWHFVYSPRGIISLYSRFSHRGFLF